jgi:hypothetical protein
MRWMNFYLILPAAPVPGVYSASNWNEYQKQKSDVFYVVSIAIQAFV